MAATHGPSPRRLRSSPRETAALHLRRPVAAVRVGGLLRLPLPPAQEGIRQPPRAAPERRHQTRGVKDGGGGGRGAAENSGGVVAPLGVPGSDESRAAAAVDVVSLPTMDAFCAVIVGAGNGGFRSRHIEQKEV